MASRADAGSRLGTDAASVDDDIDAGWDDVPESASVPVKAAIPTPLSASAPPKPIASAVIPKPARSLPPVMFAPRPRPSSRVPSYEEVRDEDLMAAEEAGAEDQSAGTTKVSVAPVLSIGPAAQGQPSRDTNATNTIAEAPAVATDETPHPSEIDVPDFRQRKPGRAAFMVVACAAMLAVAGVAWRNIARPGQHSAASVAARPSEQPTAEQARARSSPEIPPPAAPVTNQADNAAPVLEPPAGTSLEKNVTAVTVTVKTIPNGAVIFRAGQRLGTGGMELRVERNVKQRFTALHDGYRPSNFTLDGSRDHVTIVLTRAPRPRAAPAPEADSPYGDDSSASSNTATVPAPAAAEAPTTSPAPDGAPQAAPDPTAPPAESTTE